MLKPNHAVVSSLNTLLFLHLVTHLVTPNTPKHASRNIDPGNSGAIADGPLFAWKPRTRPACP
ncbi:hypothetical protein CVT25_007486 [Psilocybe cyanescens]|uniref:Uncharacterized protein n=1 Tax=Psilocybe cyanescens TaxID=93625 RepID=A0A409XVR6_PSICY|nr:hypothetical protein CVT25_007486 [Psilocybe cyanescens]